MNEGRSPYRLLSSGGTWSDFPFQRFPLATSKESVAIIQVRGAGNLDRAVIVVSDQWWLDSGHADGSDIERKGKRRVMTNTFNERSGGKEGRRGRKGGRYLEEFTPKGAKTDLRTFLEAKQRIPGFDCLSGQYVLLGS